MNVKNLIATLPFFFCIACTTSRLVELPCMSEALDDDMSYRVLGVGESVNLQDARNQAYMNVRHGMIDRFSFTIYSSGWAQTTIQAAKFSIPALQNVCEKITIDNRQNYRAYVVAKLDKAEVSDHEITLISTIGDTVRHCIKDVEIGESSSSRKHRLGNNKKGKSEADGVMDIDLKRDAFRKYADDKYEQIKNKQNETIK